MSSTQVTSNIQVLKNIEDLIERYLNEGSVEKILALYFIIERGFDTARILTLRKFSSLKAFTQVLEDLGKVDISTIPNEARELLKAKEQRLIQLLMKDARDIIDEFDPLIKKLIAVAILLDNSGKLAGDVKNVYDIYEVLSGERIPERVREEFNTYLYRLHVAELSYSSYYWGPYAPYILRALRDRVPKIIIEFKSGQEDK